MNSAAAVPEVVCRPAGVADLPQMVSLLGLLFAQEAEFRPEPARQERGLRLILEQPAAGRLYCAATADGRVWGMVSILFTISTAEGGPAAWLEDLVVLPEGRDRGLGRRLLDTAIAGARGAGCRRITLLTDADNAAAQRFYHRAGFQPSPMIPLRLALAPAD